MKKVSITAKKRFTSTKGDLNQLRNSGQVPGNIYGFQDKKVIAISIQLNDIKKYIYSPEIFFVDLEVDSHKYEVIIQALDFHPVKGVLIHIDFLLLKKDVLVKMDIPIILQGHSKGVLEGGKLKLKYKKLSCISLPKDMPSNITLKIDDLEIGDKIRIRDIQLDQVKILNAMDDSILTVRASRLVDLEEPEAVAETEAETDKEEQTEHSEEKAGASPA